MGLNVYIFFNLFDFVQLMSGLKATQYESRVMGKE